MTLLKDNNYKEINVALLSLEADIKNKITNFDTSVIDRQLAEINSRIDKINAGGNNSSDEIEDINSKLRSNSIKIGNLEQNIEDVNTQINGNSIKIRDIEQNIEGVNTQINGIEQNIEGVNTQINGIEQNIEGVNTQINGIEQNIEGINSKLNSNSIRIGNIEQNIEGVNTQINGIEQKLSDIFSAENKVTDFNTTTGSGIYYWAADTANKPGIDYGVLLVNKHDSWVNQIAYGTNNKIYFRQNINSGNWTEWKAVAFEGETATKAVEVVDYGDNSKTVKVGYYGPSVTADKLLQLAGYTEKDGSSIKLKDVSKEEVIKWLGMPRIKYHDIFCGNVQISPRGWEEFNSGLNDNEVPISAVVYSWASNTGAFYVTAYGRDPKLFYIIGSPGVAISGLTVRIYCVDKVVLS